jgi:hypothetical protein
LAVGVLLVATSAGASVFDFGGLEPLPVATGGAQTTINLMGTSDGALLSMLLALEASPIISIDDVILPTLTWPPPHFHVQVYTYARTPWFIPSPNHAAAFVTSDLYGVQIPGTSLVAQVLVSIPSPQPYGTIGYLSTQSSLLGASNLNDGPTLQDTLAIMAVPEPAAALALLAIVSVALPKRCQEPFSEECTG